MLCALTTGQRIASAIAAARPRYCQSHTVARSATTGALEHASPSARTPHVCCLAAAGLGPSGALGRLAGSPAGSTTGQGASQPQPTRLEILEVSKLDTRGHRVRWAVDGVEQLRHA